MSSDMFFIEIFSPNNSCEGNTFPNFTRIFLFLFCSFFLLKKRESHSDAAREAINSVCDAICNKKKKEKTKPANKKKVISVKKNAFCVDETVLTVVKALAGWVYVLWGL